MLGKRRIIALCISKIQDESSYIFVNELNKRIIAQGDSLFVFHTCSTLEKDEPNENGEKRIFELLPYAILDAVIIYDEKIKNFEVTKQIAKQSLAYGITTFVVGRRPLEGCIQVGYDYRAGFENVVRHVVEEHHPESVHFFNGYQNEIYSDEREQVLRKVLSEYQIPFDESMISYGNFWERPTLEALEVFNDREKMPEAIICANDEMAITVIRFLKKHGYSVPEDIIVSGFDGISGSQLFTPSLTTAQRCQDDLAAMIINLFYHKNNHQLSETKYLIEPKLKIGQSCGCKVEHLEVDGKFIYETSLRMPRHLALERILASIITKSQVADSLEEVAKEWYDLSFRNMFCIIRKECMNEKVDPFKVETENPFKDNLYVLFDNSLEQTEFRPTDTTPQNILMRLEELCNTRQPLIFTALNFLNVPLGYTCHFFSDKEIETYYQIPQIVGALSNAIGGYRNIRYQRYLRRHIEDMYKYDALTGLYNRTSFMREYDLLKQKLGKEKKKVTFVLADLDRLKYINDGFGHEEGDFALRMVADALQYACQEQSLCTRYGGDEMLAVIFENCEKDEIRARFHEYIADCNEVSVKPYEMSASIGIYQTWDFAELELADIIKQVDVLMYRDKISKKMVG